MLPNTEYREPNDNERAPSCMIPNWGHLIVYLYTNSCSNLTQLLPQLCALSYRVYDQVAKIQASYEFVRCGGKKKNNYLVFNWGLTQLGMYSNRCNSHTLIWASNGLNLGLPFLRYWTNNAQENRMDFESPSPYIQLYISMLFCVLDLRIISPNI
jgi:hypothetical protein